MTDRPQRKTSRHQAREKAFQALYGLCFHEVTGDAALQAAVRELPRTEHAPRLTGKSEEFAWELVKGVRACLPELDAVITRHSDNWRVERIAKVDLTILRLGLYEIHHRPDVPVKVAINEAVELAKAYGDENSPGFVNGILDAAAKAVEQGRAATGQ